MNMNQYRFIQPSKALKQARMDNIAIVPASLLPLKTIWQKVANTLPQGSILLCHGANKKQENILNSISLLFQQKGHMVKMMTTAGMV